MTKADYITDLKNTLIKINRQTWTEIKMLENGSIKISDTQEASPEDMETLEKAKDVLTSVAGILGKI